MPVEVDADDASGVLDTDAFCCIVLSVGSVLVQTNIRILFCVIVWIFQLSPDGFPVLL